ncbi:MAG: hypothetical protein J0H83_19260 [Candidatus Melainabacteria bacterium]|nr:hypothetical protein [Candidatus Melainabacteria bacterium]MBX9673374.1 hypothetical protein [Candidatus Obscuribacterales bacterium]
MDMIEQLDPLSLNYGATMLSTLVSGFFGLKMAMQREAGRINWSKVSDAALIAIAVPALVYLTGTLIVHNGGPMIVHNSGTL